MKLVVNADDFALTKGVSMGILDAMETGIVTSTTALVNGLYFEEDMKKAGARGINAIGIHLSLTWGKPVLPQEQVSSLIGRDGYFHRRIPLNVDYNQVMRELKAQIEKFLNHKKNPTHLDGHHHFFSFDAEIMNIVINLARYYQLPLRSINEKTRKLCKTNGVTTTKATILNFYDNEITEASLISHLDQYMDYESVELMCHPAHLDDDLEKNSSYNIKRVTEYNTLTSRDIKEYIKQRDIELVDFTKIP